jgi:hypothetical protein
VIVDDRAKSRSLPSNLCQEKPYVVEIGPGKTRGIDLIQDKQPVRDREEHCSREQKVIKRYTDRYIVILPPQQISIHVIYFVVTFLKAGEVKKNQARVE